CVRKHIHCGYKAKSVVRLRVARTEHHTTERHMQNQILTAIVSATIAFFAGAYLANAQIGTEYEYPSYSDFPRTYGIGYAEQDYSSTFGTWCDESCKLYVPDSGRYFTPDCPRIIDGYIGDLSKKGHGTY